MAARCSRWGPLGREVRHLQCTDVRRAAATETPPSIRPAAPGAGHRPPPPGPRARGRRHDHRAPAHRVGQHPGGPGPAAGPARVNRCPDHRASNDGTDRPRPPQRRRHRPPSRRPPPVSTAPATNPGDDGPHRAPRSWAAASPRTTPPGASATSQRSPRVEGSSSDRPAPQGPGLLILPAAVQPARLVPHKNWVRQGRRRLLLTAEGAAGAAAVRLGAPAAPRRRGGDHGAPAALPVELGRLPPVQHFLAHPHRDRGHHPVVDAARLADTQVDGGDWLLGQPRPARSCRSR